MLGIYLKLDWVHKIFRFKNTFFRMIYEAAIMISGNCGVNELLFIPSGC